MRQGHSKTPSVHAPPASPWRARERNESNAPKAAPSSPSPRLRPLLGRRQHTDLARRRPEHPRGRAAPPCGSLRGPVDPGNRAPVPARMPWGGGRFPGAMEGAGLALDPRALLTRHPAPPRPQTASAGDRKPPERPSPALQAEQSPRSRDKLELVKQLQAPRARSRLFAH